MVVLYVPEECDFAKIRKLRLRIENVNMLFPYVLLLATVTYLNDLLLFLYINCEFSMLKYFRI